MEKEVVINIENVKKQYRLGTIGGGTLSADIQSWWAKVRGKEDPNTKLNAKLQVGEKFWALNGVNLEIRRGEAVGIIGMNGAGKSTLLKILSRVTLPTEGDIWIKGRLVSMLEVGTGFHPELTGRENIYMNGAILGMSRKEVDKKIEDIIEFSECRQFIDTPVKRYSSGMYVKLAFAVAAHLDADIMIMDEVLAVGDMKFQKKCLSKMGDAAGTEGKTILYVSHNMSTIRQLCSRCVVMKHGNIIFDGDVEEAIQIYMDESINDLNVEYDLSNLVRSNTELGKKLFIKSFKFLNKEKAIFKCGESLRYSLILQANEELDGFAMQAVVRYADSTIAGMAMVKVNDKLEKNKTYEMEFAFDASNIVEGNYYFSPIICTFSDTGAREVYDVSPEKISFSLYNQKQNEVIQWNRTYWGHVQLNDIVKMGDIKVVE